MNKFITKLAKLTLGLALASGVGVAVGSNKKAENVKAASAWQAHTGSITAGSEYLIVKVDGSKCMQPANTSSSGTTTTSAGGYSQNDFTASSGPDMGFIFADAGSGNFYIMDGSTYVRANGTTNNGLCSATSNTTNPSYGTWVVTETSTSGEYTIINTNGTGRQISAYSTSNWRSYAITSGSKTNVKLYEKAATPQTITVDPASKEAYTDETFSLTTNATSASWALSNNTCGASLSAASGKTVSVSATGAGSVRVTATASGYTSPYVDLTFIEKPTSPFITPEKATTSGYTGLNETIAFTYGNLSSSLGIVSSDTSVVTVETPSYSDGEGTVQINFVAAGTTTVKFNDGSSELASLTVTVTASTVTISGLAATGNAYIGKTLDLGSTITVTATGSYSDAVSWESDDDSIATVSTAGVVTGVSEGTVDIIVTSDDYPSATATCSVTVSEVVAYELVTDVSKLADGTQFVLVDYVSSTYRIAKDLNSGHIKMNTITSKTEVSGTSSGDTVITEEADVFTLVGSEGAWEIMRGDTYLQFTGTSNGNDSFTASSGADTKFSIVASSTENKVTINSNSRSNRALRHNTSTGDLRNYSNSGNQTDLYMFAVIPAQNELDHVTTTGQTTSFTAGNTFSYGGTLTAYYTINDPATQTPSSYKLDSESGLDITTSTVLTKAEHDGHEIYVLYTENNITKSAHYTITVDYAAVTSVVIDTHSAEIGLNEVFDYSQVGVTVSSQYSDPGYEWIVSANTVSDDYAFDGSGLLSGDTEGTITLRCRSTADNSKYDELVVTVTGDPTANFTEDSISGYVGKGASVAFTYGNIDDTSKISVSSSSAAVSVGAISASNENGSVAITFVSAGSATLTIHYDGGSALDSITVTVSADSVVALNWTASNINVYSGAVLPVAIEDTWMVNYEMASGDADFITYSDGDYTVKLGGSTISLPHTWGIEDDGKALCVEYMGFESSTVSVSVTQTLRPIMAAVPGESAESNLTFAAKAEGSGTADDEKSWTVTSDGTESNFDTTKGIHFGTSSGSVQYIKLTSSDFTEGTITKVVVNASTASGVSATAGVKVNGVQFGGEPKSLSTTATDYTFTGSVSAGEIEVEITKPSSATKAIYCKSIVVTYQTASGESVDIANVAGHEAAQKAVVKFAKAFNVALGATENCTTGLSSAWSSATSAWNTFLSEASALGSSEEAYAKNLVKYATAQWTEGTDSDYSYCLERALATYEACVNLHGQEAFMSAVRTVSSARINSISLFNGENNSVAIIVIISMVSMTTIGAFFFIRKRKENI